jgi:hypothetical protein
LITASFTIAASGGALADEASRKLRAAFVPHLRLGAALARMDGRGGPWSVSAWAALSWPIDGLGRDPVDRIRLHRGDSLAARTAEIWRKREALRKQAEEEATDAARLDAEEADAELNALTGEVEP